MEEDIDSVSKSIRRERVARARRMTVDERVSEGGPLFDYACSITISGIKCQNPGISDADAMFELRRRFAIGERRQARTVSTTGAS